MKDKEFNEISETLQRLKSAGDGFRTPSPDYFDQLAQRVVDEASAVPAPKQYARRRLLWPSLYAVAAALLLLLWWQPWQVSEVALTPQVVEASTTDQSGWESALAALSEEDILAYIDENIQDFELETLIETTAD